MAEAADQEAEKPRRGPKPQARKKALISMTAAEYDEFSAWADEAGMTKAMLMHDMMGRERERRASLRPVDAVESSAAGYEKSPSDVAGPKGRDGEDESPRIRG